MSDGPIDKFGVDPIVGIVVMNEDPKGLGRCDVVVAEYGPKPLRAVPPLWPPFIEAVPDVNDPVRLLEFPGGKVFYAALHPAKACTTDAAVLYAPLKALLMPVFDALDKLATHVHLCAAPGSPSGPPLTPEQQPIITPPVTTIYGDAKQDLEDDKPKSRKVRIVTSVPHGENG